MRSGHEHGRRSRRVVLSTALAAALALGAMPAAAQGPAVGGQNGADGESTKASATGEGVPYPEEQWTRVLEDITQVGGDEYEPVFDSEGHILYQGIDQATDPNQQVLVAIDTATGEVDWTRAGVSAGCGVAASDDGVIYGTTEVTGPDQLVAIDAATGELIETFQPQVHGADGMSPCRESLRLADDGTLVSLNSYGFEMHLQAFDTTGGLSHKWTIHYHETGGGADDESTSELDRPVISADGTALYHCREVLERNRPDDADDLVQLEKIDLATGTIIDRVDLLENARCHTTGVVAVDDGVVLGASGASTEYEMFHVVDGGNELTIDWSTVYSRNEDLDESGVGNYPGDQLSLSGDTIVFRGAGGGRHWGVDVATGEVLWDHSVGLNNPNLAVDAHGNLYTASHDWILTSFTGNGHPRFEVEREALLGDDSTFGTQWVTVGPDGGVFLRGEVRGDHSTFVRVDAAPRRRVAGVSRFDTAAKLALGNFRRGVDTVYLATGTNFPDALTAGPLAALDDAPVLLAAPTLLPPETRSALRDLEPESVIAIGGEAAISNDVLAEAAEAADDAATDRIFGANRFGTAAAIAHQLPPSDVVYIGTGANYPDALSGGPATDGAPILLATRDVLPQETIASLGDRKPTRVVALGGPAAISDDVLARAAQAAGASSTGRLQGDDRFTTALAIADEVVAGDGFAGTVYVATGTNYPDAVTAAPPAESAGAPIVLVAPGFIPGPVADWLEDLDGLEHVVILGGEAAISADVEAQLTALVG